MILKHLNENQMADIYATHMVVDFPTDELKPFEYISKLINENMYFAYGLFDEDKLFAYAFLFGHEDSKYVLLDYFAVCGSIRGQGIGSICLMQLAQKCSDFEGIFIEVENAEYAADEAERTIRNRRIAFYEKNGAATTDILCRLFGVDMNIMILNTSDKRETCLKQNLQDTAELYEDTADLYEELQNLYCTMFDEKVFNDKVELSRT